MVPVTKKTPCAWYFFSSSSTRGVHTGSGPSSKVSTIRWSGIRSVSAGSVALRASMTGPPSRTCSGTRSVAAGGWIRWSARISLCT